MSDRELRALVTAYGAIMESAVKLHPLVLAAVRDASRPGGQEPPDGPDVFAWPEGNRSVRGAAWEVTGTLENAFDEIRGLSDDMALMVRRLDEAEAQT